MKYLSIFLLFITLSCNNSKIEAVTENNDEKTEKLDTVIIEKYKPSQPISFPHSLHLKVDCKYCHYSVDNTKIAKLPTIDVCFNCHSVEKGDSNSMNKLGPIK